MRPDEVKDTMFTSAATSRTCNNDWIKPIRSGESLRRWMMTIVSVSVAIASSSVACASCGDYLYRNGKQVINSSFSMVDHNSSRALETAPVELPVPPCHGPNCTGQPLPLMPVPVVPTNLVRGFDQAAILESLTTTPTPRRNVEIPVSERGACFVPSPIFRPPMV